MKMGPVTGMEPKTRVGSRFYQAVSRTKPRTLENPLQQPPSAGVKQRILTRLVDIDQLDDQLVVRFIFDTDTIETFKRLLLEFDCWHLKRFLEVTAYKRRGGA